MTEAADPPATLGDLLKRRDALAERLRPFGNLPRRDRSGDWYISHRAPAGLVRAWIALAEQLDSARKDAGVERRRDHVAG